MDAYKNLLTLRRGKTPGQLVIQMTDKCNARCPQCGMRVTEPFRRTRLSSDDIKRIIDSAAEKGVKVLSFTGGEPLLLFDDLIQLIHYAGRAGVEFIRTGTNGFVFANSDRPGFRSKVRRMAEALASTPLRNFWISIDSSVPSVHETMRGFPGIIAGIEKAIPIFHEAGLYPSANLGINRNISGNGDEKSALFAHPSTAGRGKDYLEAFHGEMREGFRRFYRFVIGLGFTIVNTCYPMSVDEESDGDALQSVYAATSTDRIVRFSPEEKSLLFRALMETIPEFRSQIRIFSPRASLYALHKHYAGQPTIMHPCRGGIDYFFIDSRDGNAYPCGYRGNESFGKFWDMPPDGPLPATDCFQCDWECFRDPSELFGPLLRAVNDPLGLFRMVRLDKRYFRIWLEDLRYYKDCDFFDGRRPPRPDRLRRF